MKIRVVKKGVGTELKDCGDADFEIWKVMDQEDLDKRLNSEGVKSLVELDGSTIASFKALEEGAKYGLGAEKAQADAPVLAKLTELTAAVTELNFERKQQKQAVQTAVQRYQARVAHSSPAHVSGGNTSSQISDAYEDNAVQLLVKCIYNGGQGEFNISSKWRNRLLSKKKLASGKEPDFYAEVSSLSSTQPTYPQCFCSTKQKHSPQIFDESDLVTPPQSPILSSLSLQPTSGVAVFEITQDVSLWQNKLTKLDAYVGELKSDNVLLAGLVFLTPDKFQAVKQNVSKFANLKPLHDKGHFFYVLCDQTFVKATHSQTSSNSRDLRALSTFTVEFAEALFSIVPSPTLSAALPSTPVPLSTTSSAAVPSHAASSTTPP